MGIIARAIRDINRITGNLDGFGVAITLTAPTGEIANITGLHSKTHLAVDTDGNAMSTKQARVSFSEQNLVTANPLYPFRNANGDVDLEKHLVDVADSTGVIKHYMVSKRMPDETVGLILIYLEEYGED
jgi:hypothetical protein